VTREQAVTLVPSWFGMGPAELRSQVVGILRQAGAVQSNGGLDEFRLDVRAVANLRRAGLAARNDRHVEVARELVGRNHTLIDRNLRALTELRASLGMIVRTLPPPHV